MRKKGNNGQATLLEKALSHSSRPQVRKVFSDEDMELAMAWIQDRVTLTQVNVALGKNPTTATSAYMFMARALKWMYQNGLIAIKGRKEDR